MHNAPGNTDHAVPDLVDTGLIEELVLEGRPDESGSVHYVPLVQQPFTIGRSPENHLPLANSTVSSFHAEILQVDDGLFVRDLDSTNGTLLNGRRVQGIAGLCDGDMLHFGNAMYTLRARARGFESDTVKTDTAEDTLGQIQFAKLINNPAVSPWFQPIIRLENRELIGYEALSRSRLVGLETPDKMFRIAAQLASTTKLSEVCRTEAMRASKLLGDQKHYYLNTHPSELNTPELIVSLQQLREAYPAQEIVLEVHESGATSTEYLQELRKGLDDLQIGLAYDDFGSGQARLMELSEVPPDILKFDINMIRGICSASSQRQTTVAALVRIARDLGAIPLAEGIESETEARTCFQLGFELGQGFLFGRAERATHWLPR